MSRFLPDLVEVALLKALAGAPYISPTKVLTVVRCELHKWLRVPRPTSLPYVAIIDVVNTCNLRCPYCPTGARRDSGRTTRMVEVSHLEDLIKQLGRHLVAAHFYNWGEPLLHPEIAAIVRMFHSGRVSTFISSNLSIKNDAVLDALCDAGLDYLTVSVSGASQEVYEQYHCGGSIQRVIENTERLTENKRRNGRRRPFIEWKYLVFRHNAHEVQAARKLASTAGVNVFRTVRAGGADEAVVWDHESSDNRQPTPRCPQLWDAVVLNSDGGIAPCCYLFFKQDDFAHVSEGPIEQIRQNDSFVTARKFFNASCVADLPKDLTHPCLKCTVVHSQPHLREYLEANRNAVQDHRTGGP